jgi:hypothetical protein
LLRAPGFRPRRWSPGPEKGANAATAFAVLARLDGLIDADLPAFESLVRKRRDSTAAAEARLIVRIYGTADLQDATG